MKAIKANYVALNYNSALGYSLLIQDCQAISIRATFCDAESTKEYLEAKTGKVMARRFEDGFDLIKQLIISAPNYRTELISDFYVYEGGVMKTKTNK